MNTVQFEQLIYTRVEAAYSPYMRSGFQTVYKSESLSPSVVDAIERHVQCFVPHHPTIVRLQFFSLNAGKVALTSSTQIDAHPEIVDSSRRRGAFIAHCLVLNRSEFSKVEYNPFTVLDHYHFLDNAEEMVRAFGQATGVAPTVTIEVKQPGYEPLFTWKGEEVQKLVSVALQAERLGAKKQSVLLVGEEKEITEALRIVSYLMPKDKRLLCTFDTYTDHCPIQQHRYWAVGTARRQSSGSYIQVDATERRVIGPVEDIGKGQDLYLSWLRMASSQESSTTLVHRAPTAQLLATAFTERTHLQFEELNEEACIEFMRLHEERITRDLETVLSRMVGKNIAMLLSPYLGRRPDPSALLDIAAAQHIDLTQMSVLLADWIEEEKPILKDRDWKMLRSLARKAGNMRLLFLASTLCGNVDVKACNEALSSIDIQAFQEALHRLVDPIAPAHFVTRRYLSLLLSDSRLWNMTDQQFVGLVKAIMEIGAADQLDALAEFVELLPSESLAQLERMIGMRPIDIPQRFAAAVATRRKELS